MALLRGEQSNAMMLTSGGTIVMLTEKATANNVDLLTQKKLYVAAVSLGFFNPQFYYP